MSEQKVYVINEKEFVLAPLTWRQRKLVSPVEQEIRKLIFDLAAIGSDKNPSFGKIFDSSISVDNLLYAEDNRFLKFLAIILIPKGERFNEKKIEENAKLFEDITDETIARVLEDFFTRSTSSILSMSQFSPSSGKPLETSPNRAQTV